VPDGTMNLDRAHRLARLGINAAGAG
jgi:hypothetical protein